MERIRQRPALQQLRDEEQRAIVRADVVERDDVGMGGRAHSEGCSEPYSRTIRTARSLTSDEYLVGRHIGPIPSIHGPSDKPGTVHSPLYNLLKREFEELWRANQDEAEARK